MVKCSKSEVQRLKTALRWKIPTVQRERIQMVLLRESGLTLWFPKIPSGRIEPSRCAAGRGGGGDHSEAAVR